MKASLRVRDNERRDKIGDQSGDDARDQHNECDEQSQ